MLRRHTNTQYEAELEQVRNALLYMGGELERNIREAMSALNSGDSALARAVVQRDHLINCLEVEVDDLCLGILARRQPVASDLRFLAATFKMVTDLERIGDQAGHIAEQVLKIVDKARHPLPDELREMADTAQGMLTSALDAFVRREASLAEKVIADDAKVDKLNSKLVDMLEDALQEGPQAAMRMIHTLNIARYLERIGDHTVNISEMVIFFVKGQDIRHMWSRQRR